MIRVGVGCVTNVTRLLWIGVANALLWTVLTGWPVVAQQDRFERLDDRVRTAETSVAVLSARLDLLTAGVQDIRLQIDTLLKALLGGFVTIIGALVATLWSIRQGWIVATPKGGP